MVGTHAFCIMEILNPLLDCLHYKYLNFDSEKETRGLPVKDTAAM